MAVEKQQTKPIVHIAVDGAERCVFFVTAQLCYCVKKRNRHSDKSRFGRFDARIAGVGVFAPCPTVLSNRYKFHQRARNVEV